MTKPVSFRKAKKGQSLAEYGLILALISVVCIGIMTTMGGEIKRVFTQLNTAISGVQVNTGP